MSVFFIFVICISSLRYSLQFWEEIKYSDPNNILFFSITGSSIAYTVGRTLGNMVNNRNNKFGNSDAFFAFTQIEKDSFSGFQWGEILFYEEANDIVVAKSGEVSYVWLLSNYFNTYIISIITTTLYILVCLLNPIIQLHLF